MREPRVTYLPRPITLSGLLAGGEHRMFVAQGTGLSVNLEYNLHGISVYVTGPNGWDQNFESMTGDPADQAPAWEHASKLLARAFGTQTPTSELADEDDDLLVSTAAAAISAHRGRKTAALAARNAEHIFTPSIERGWASRGGRRKLTPAQREALATGAQHNGLIRRAVDAPITTLKALIKLGYATPIEGPYQGRTTLIGAALTALGSKLVTT